MDNRLEQILGIYKSKESTNVDKYLNFQIEGNERLLPPGHINKVLDLTEQFVYERQKSKYYRLAGKINPLITNALFNLTGPNDSWETFNDPLFKLNQNLQQDNDFTFGQSIQTHLKEKEGWYGYYNLILNKLNACNIFIDMEPKRERFSFIPDITNVSNTNIKNWDLTITYPYSSDTTHYVVKNGLIIIDKISVIVGGKPMTALSVPVFHNLLEGDTIALSGTNADGEYLIRRVGLDNGDLKQNYFCIDIDFNNLTLTTNSRMSKIYNNVHSEYYFRKFKKIKTRSSNTIEPDDYEVYNIAFSKTIFSDDVCEFVFNEDIDTNDLVDNLGRPLTELYLTIIKTDSNNIFSKVSSGIEAPVLPTQYWNTANINQYLKQVPVIQKIHNVPVAPSQTFTPLELDVKITDDDFYGDIVEYNKTNAIEVILSDVQYRFSTINRETTGNLTVPGPRPEGYYYKAHHLIQLRLLSSYIEEGDQYTVGMPTYAVDLGDGRFFWRNILDVGASDIKNGLVNYPFLNGVHYLFENYCFEVKRQDPFDNWDIYFSSFPPDPIGKKPTNKFKINISDNVC